MKRLRWPLLILAVCLPLIILAAGVRLPGLEPVPFSAPLPVPAGDVEVAWFNVTTASAAWERFVAGAEHAQSLVPGLKADSSAAFPVRTTAVPEVRLACAGRPGVIRIRWYKLSMEGSAEEWMARLARRDPPPLAVIGGSTSDRARDLAAAIVGQTGWHGPPPLLLLTNATADRVYLHGRMQALTEIYPGRTFRLCFNNRQMAEAILDFVWRHPSLRPQSIHDAAVQALCSGIAGCTLPPHRAAVFRVGWDDDPYSADLHDQFSDLLPQVLALHDRGEPPDVFRYEIPFSIGGFSLANEAEREAAAGIVNELRDLPAQRALLVIPTVAAPARRMVRALCSIDPVLARRLVAVNGDGMGANTLLRDGEFLWPAADLPMPLLLFSHANPTGWNGGLQPPNSTDEAFHAAELIRLIAGGCDAPRAASADDLLDRFRGLQPPFFGPTGDRVGGTGEFVLWWNPADRTAANGPDVNIEVWRRQSDRSWSLERAWPHRQSRQAAP